MLGWPRPRGRTNAAREHPYPMSRAFTPIAASFGAAAAVGAGMVLFAPAWLPAMARVVASYDAAAITLLIWYGRLALRNNAAQTRTRAAQQDPGRTIATAVILVAVAFGFVAAFDILGRGPHLSAPAHQAPVYALGFAAVVLGWLLIHIVLLFHYAHAYYRDRNRDNASDGGLIFPGKEAPSDIDFAYFSFVLGMTFQVSDVQITDSSIRRVALMHGLISFAYNTAILALVVNVVSNLLH